MDKLKRIVLFSNDTECLSCLTKIANKCSEIVIALDNESEVLNKIREHKVDMVLLSLGAKVDEKPLCDVIRAIDKHLPIILISGDSGVGDYSLYFKGVDTLTKPIDSEILLRKIKLYKDLTDARVTLENILPKRRKED
jgi:two-component SAPR family response regulator